jgi:hypothetical protein
MAETPIGDMDIFGILQRMGLERSISARLAAVLFAFCGVGSMFLRNKDDLMNLCLLSLTSYVVFYHQGYDLVILVFPLWYCMKHGITNPITALFAGLIILTWYLQAVVALVETQQRFNLSVLSFWMNSGLHAATTILLYGTIAYLTYLHFAKPRLTLKEAA